MISGTRDTLVVWDFDWRGFNSTWRDEEPHHIRAEHAAAKGNRLWIDMESTAFVEQTVGQYARLAAGHGNTGLCLQAYLKQKWDGLVRLLPLDWYLWFMRRTAEKPSNVWLAARNLVARHPSKV